MQTDALVHAYLDALAAADSDRVVALFSDDGVVYSPLYGTVAAREFYPKLFADTSEARLTHRATMTGEYEGRPILSFWFDFEWVLAHGVPAPFTAVDVAELDDDGRITRLHIVYDTHPIRHAFDSLPG
jgi:hypothetical protein